MGIVAEKLPASSPPPFYFFMYTGGAFIVGSGGVGWVCTFIINCQDVDRLLKK